MPPGGARNRSGPQPDPNSLRSAQRSQGMTALPSEGFKGEVPDFPLPEVSARESVVWETAWQSPQACAWVTEPWRHRTIAMWVRWSVRMEETDSNASLGATTMRLADQIGMTPAGLKENGWKIVADEVAGKRSGQVVAAASSSRSRLKVVSSADDGD